MQFVYLLKSFTAVAITAICMGSSLAADPKKTSRLTVTGASTIAPLMADIAKAHDAKFPLTRTDVQAGGSSRAIADVRKGSAQIGMVSRALYDDEKDLSRLLIGRDGIAMVVHKTNPIQKLSKEQVIDIYTGKVKNWNAVGGPDLPITVVSKAEGRSTLEVFSAYFGLPYRAIKAHAVVGDNQQEIMTIAGSKGSIGYVSIGSAEYEQKNGSPIKLVQLDKYVPSSQAVAEGSYPISRELNLVYRKPLSKEAQSLLDFSAGAGVRQYVTSHFFIPVK